jgi:hypothetical protein
MLLAAQQTFSWGYELLALALGFGGLWLNFVYLGPSRADKVRYRPPARLQAGGKVSSFFFLGGAVIIAAAPLVHHKISVLGVVCAILVLIGFIVCIASCVILVGISVGRIPKFLLRDKISRE